MNVILLGLPGAGKGTQAALITETQRIPHISTGDLFRKAYQEQTELGRKAKDYMNRGELVPDEVTIGIALRRLEGTDCKQGFLLDGFPRNIVQAQELDRYLASNSMKIDYVVYVEADEDILLKRLTGRRVCSDCGNTYHITNKPPKVKSRCDTCSGSLVQREDDQEDTVKERLRVNRELTTGLVDFYGKLGILHTINGSNDIAQVSNDLLQIFGKGIC